MSYNSVVRSDDPNAVKLLSENVKFLEDRIGYMQKINDHYKENGTVVGCPGIDDAMAHELDGRANESGAVPYPGKFFKDNSDSIQQTQKIMERETLFQGWKFAGGEAVVNLANNRLQLKFDEKPDKKQLAVIKKSGFKWAFKAKAWQRKLDRKTFAAADKMDFVKPLDGRNPSEIQPKTPKKDAPER